MKKNIKKKSFLTSLVAEKASEALFLSFFRQNLIICSKWHNKKSYLTSLVAKKASEALFLSFTRQNYDNLFKKTK